MSVIDLAARITAPWAHLYNDSKLVSIGVVFVHLAGLLLGGGFAIAADRTILRLSPATAALQSRLQELHSIHRPVVLGLALTFGSGALLFAADVRTFLPAPLFWLKMTLITILLWNGVVLRKAESALRAGTARPQRAWQRLHRAARASLALWFGALLLGTALLAA